MKRAISTWLQQNNHVEDDLDQLANKLSPSSYTIYGRMLLLPAKAFESPEWQRFRQDNRLEDPSELYDLLAEQLKVSHIAINRPIPPKTADGHEENAIRAPNNFTPLHGDFGPSTCDSPPTQGDFDNAFWTTTRQNGIAQTWAPLWTMFSRGNISEKTRLVGLPSVLTAVQQGRLDGRGSAAVDLYVGIGYFAFSYLKAGVDCVLGWDINPWSVEGLRRGAKANKWHCRTFDGSRDSLDDVVRAKAKMMVFNESNALASQRIHAMRASLPAIRHVNCGLLPTSRDSWDTAISVLDPEMGGWIHVHENFAISEIDHRAEEVRRTFETLVNTTEEKVVRLDFVHRLKSYAPGVMHCVLDISILPRTAV